MTNSFLHDLLLEKSVNPLTNFDKTKRNEKVKLVFSISKELTNRLYGWALFHESYKQGLILTPDTRYLTGTSG